VQYTFYTGGLHSRPIFLLEFYAHFADFTPGVFSMPFFKIESFHLTVMEHESGQTAIDII